MPSCPRMDYIMYFVSIPLQPTKAFSKASSFPLAVWFYNTQHTCSFVLLNTKSCVFTMKNISILLNAKQQFLPGKFTYTYTQLNGVIFSFAESMFIGLAKELKKFRFLKEFFFSQSEIHSASNKASLQSDLTMFYKGKYLHLNQSWLKVCIWPIVKYQVNTFRLFQKYHTHVYSLKLKHLFELSQSQVFKGKYLKRC